MSESVAEKLSAPDFNAEKYVRELSQKCVGGQELQQQRKTIQNLSESTNVLLKKNVFQNYMQFIETAKEITHLESEMYQLSHLLSEQRTLLETLSNTSIIGDHITANKVQTNGNPENEKEDQEKREEEERRRKLTSILEKVEGCVGLLEVPDRRLLHEGDLLELNPVDNSTLRRTHAYLFTDGLMLTSWISNRRGPVRYKMYAQYELGSLAVVNVRDLGPIKFAFKILVFPDTRLFQCSNLNSKKEWLDKCDQAKKLKLNTEQIKREVSQSQSSLDSPITTSRTSSMDSPTNPFEEPEQTAPDWVLDSIEELDVLIAERHFEEALELLEKVKNYLDSLSKEDSKDAVIIDIKTKIDQRKKHFQGVLIKELEVSPDKSLQGGLRAARRAVRLLNALDKSTQLACELMLGVCTSILKKEMKNVIKEGSCVLYVQQLSNIFYSNLVDIVKEFLATFTNVGSCLSCLVVWVSQHVTIFVNNIVRQIFVPQTSFSQLTQVYMILVKLMTQLNTHGLDLRFQMDAILRTPLTRAVSENKEKLTEALKHRASDEKWHPINLQNKNNLNKLIQEITDLGLVGAHSYVKGDCWIELTSNTISFTKLYMNLVHDILKLYSTELQYLIDDTLYEVLKTQLKLIEGALVANKQNNEIQLVIHKNCVFILDTLLPVVEHNYEQTAGVPCVKLTALASEFYHLKKNAAKPVPAPRQTSIHRYTTEEYV